MPPRWILRAALLAAAFSITGTTLVVPPAAPYVHAVEFIGWVTGTASHNDTKEVAVQGADLGLMFPCGDQVCLAFGDTFSSPPSGEGPTHGGWRPNALAYSSDNTLDDGLNIDRWLSDGYGWARQFLAPIGCRSIIPTAGIELDSRLLIHYMCLEANEGHDFEVTYSGLAYSDTDGQAWEQPPDSTWQGETGFSQAAFVREGDWLYVFGTEGGRTSGASLARVPSDAALDLAQYAYWDGRAWQPDIANAALVIPNPVGEMSVCYNETVGRWLSMYMMPGEDAIVMRAASSLTGPWSEAAVVVPWTTERWGTYGPFIHPDGCGDWMYFTLSQWGPYNVGLWRTRIAGVW